MSYQTIIVPALDGTVFASDAARAVTLARTHKAHVEAIFVRQRPIMPAGAFHPYSAPYVDEHFSQLVAAENEQAASLKAEFERICNDAGIVPDADSDAGPTASWGDAEGAIPHLLGVKARTGDLVVMGKPTPQAPDYWHDLVVEILFQSACPVLLATGSVDPAPKHVLVAWNGSREGSQAIRAALPFLQAAETVTVAAIGELPYGNPGPDMACDWLVRHRVNIKPHVIEDTSRDPEDLLDELAGKTDAKLIVMGAYSHSRLRQMILGGFTRHFLRESAVPVLMAH